MAGNSNTTGILSKKLLARAVLAAALIGLLLFPAAPSWLALLPFLVLTTKGVDLSLPSGIFLTIIWTIYTLAVTLPLYWVLGRFFVLLVYLPINAVVFAKAPHDPASRLFLSLQTVFWDVPLLLWMRIVSLLGGRALRPFHSQITPLLALGSLPLDRRDAAFLAEQGATLVVNMCREHGGPQEEYAALGLTQLRLPTPDICEPSYSALLQGVRAAVLHMAQGRGVFVHCKAGRGRSAAFALCLLMARGASLSDAAALVREKRPIIESYVLEFKVVARFDALLRRCSGSGRAVEEVLQKELEEEQQQQLSKGE